MDELIFKVYVGSALVGFFFTIAWLLACAALDIVALPGHEKSGLWGRAGLVPFILSIGATAFGLGGTFARLALSLPFRYEIAFACALGIGVALVTRYGLVPPAGADATRDRLAARMPGARGPAARPAPRAGSRPRAGVPTEDAGRRALEAPVRL